jgi:thiamine biosynthesis lipoprotein
LKKIFIILLLSTLLLSGCVNNNDSKTFSNQALLLDTTVTITLFEDNKEAFEKSFELIEYYENMLSSHKEMSDIYKINHSNGDLVSVNEITIELIKKAKEYSILTNGLFDISIGSLIELWDINNKDDGSTPPSQSDINNAINFTGNDKVKILNNSIQLDAGVMLDLGGIAKGFIADKVAQNLVEMGIERGIINLGGNVFVLGSKVDGSDYRIGVQDPDDNRGDYMGVLSVSNQSVVTSGIYERYFITDGVHYHHILDPFSGFPSNNDLKSVTIVSELSVDGDALSTSVFLLGVDKGLKFVEDLKNIDAILITKDNKVYCTSGINDVFEITSSKYEKAN